MSGFRNPLDRSDVEVTCLVCGGQMIRSGVGDWTCPAERSPGHGDPRMPNAVAPIVVAAPVDPDLAAYADISPKEAAVLKAAYEFAKQLRTPAPFKTYQQAMTALLDAAADLA